MKKKMSKSKSGRCTSFCSKVSKKDAVEKLELLVNKKYFFNFTTIDYLNIIIGEIICYFV